MTKTKKIAGRLIGSAAAAFLATTALPVIAGDTFPSLFNGAAHAHQMNHGQFHGGQMHGNPGGFQGHQAPPVIRHIPNRAPVIRQMPPNRGAIQQQQHYQQILQRERHQRQMQQMQQMRERQENLMRQRQLQEQMQRQQQMRQWQMQHRIQQHLPPQQPPLRHNFDPRNRQQGGNYLPPQMPVPHPIPHGNGRLHQHHDTYINNFNGAQHSYDTRRPLDRTQRLMLQNQIREMRQQERMLDIEQRMMLRQLIILERRNERAYYNQQGYYVLPEPLPEEEDCYIEDGCMLDEYGNPYYPDDTGANEGAAIVNGVMRIIDNAVQQEIEKKRLEQAQPPAPATPEEPPAPAVRNQIVPLPN
jgi:hypothetical protein